MADVVLSCLGEKSVSHKLDSASKLAKNRNSATKSVNNYYLPITRGLTYRQVQAISIQYGAIKGG